MGLGKELEDFGRSLEGELPEIIQGAFEQSALNLVQQLQTSATNEHGGGFLAQSISALPMVVENGKQTISIDWEIYGDFQDKGVKGKGGNRKADSLDGKHKKGQAFEQKAPGSKFFFKDKMPPTNFSTIGGKSLSQIAQEIGVSPFAVSMSIFKKGIKPSLWASSILDDNALIDKLFDDVGLKFVKDMNS